MGRPTPQGPGYDRFRKREDRGPFYWALAASAMVHLSMVTVFSIVVYFPREDTSYYDFRIVPLATESGAVVANGPTPLDEATTLPGEDRLALRGASENGLPSLELPTLEFAELERLRVRQEGLETLSRYDDIFKPPPDDSWARFSRGLSGVSRSLSQLRLSGTDEDSPTDLLDSAPPETIVHRPARGFEARLVWASAPRDRQLLFAPPIEALWEAETTALQRPVELVLDVNALGRVVNVFSPNVEDAELVDDIQLTVLRYRFEPLALEDGARQTATLRIGRESPGAAP